MVFIVVSITNELNESIKWTRKKKNGTHIRQLAHKLSLMNFNDAFCKVICLEKSRSSLVFSIGCALCSLFAATYISDYFCHDRRIHNWVILTKYGFQYRTRIYTNDVTDMLCSDDLRTYCICSSAFSCASNQLKWNKYGRSKVVMGNEYLQKWHFSCFFFLIFIWWISLVQLYKRRVN